jgi:hypothetical protein
MDRLHHRFGSAHWKCPKGAVLFLAPTSQRVATRDSNEGERGSWMRAKAVQLTLRIVDRFWLGTKLLTFISDRSK